MLRDEVEDHLAADRRDPQEAHDAPQVGEPVPRQEARHGADDILPLGGARLPKRLWARRHSAVDEQRAGLVQETAVHGPGMQVDAAVQWVWFRIETPEGSSSLLSDSLPLSAYHRGYTGEGASISIKGLQPTPTASARTSLRLLPAPEAQR